MLKRIIKPAKTVIEKLILAPVDKAIMPVIEKLFVARLKWVNKRRFKAPRKNVDTRTVLVYSPNIGGHRPIYSARFIDYYRRHGFEVYFIYCGLEVNIKQRIYSEFKSPFTESFKDDRHVHLICANGQLTGTTDELEFIVGLQKKYTPAITIFVDGDVLMKTFQRQATRGSSRLLGRNYAVFIMIDYIYRDMSLQCLSREPKKREQVPQLLFHKYYFRHLDLLDGALVSDENLVRKCRPSKHIPFGDIIHFELPPDNESRKKRFFARVMRQYDEFLSQHPDKDVILQFGELEERKGYDFLLRLVAETPDLVLVRAGRTKPSYRIKWDSLLYKEELMLQDRLFEIDIFIDSQEFIDKLFRSIRFFLFSYKDHFRTSIMMPLALSYGKSVMVPSVGLLKWRVNQHKVGCVYQHRSYESFAEEFVKFRATYDTHLDNVKKYYAADFSDEAFDRRLDQITHAHAKEVLDEPSGLPALD